MAQINKHRRPATPKQAARCCGPIDDLLDPALFKALADPTRAGLLACIAKCGRGCSVGEIAQCCDIIQPDVGWCGGMSELIRIADLADAAGVLTVPHGSSVYSYHFVVTRHNSPFAEFLMMAPKADEVVPMFAPLLLDEPAPHNGRLKLSDAPGFGVRLNPACRLQRPYARDTHRGAIEASETLGG